MNINEIKAQFDHIAEKYDARRKCFIPCFADFYKNSVSLLKNYRKDLLNIVDLGAGTGLLTKEIFEIYKNAHYTLIDISGDMLKIAQERFKGLNNFDFIEENYVENIPVKNCDLVCSALSIHHLENEQKVKLYQKIYKILAKGGCLINLDQFIGESDLINKLYTEWWYNYIDSSGLTKEEKAAWLKRRKLDRENTINETIKILKNSGFNNVTCIYQFMQFGVIIAIK
ncbi:MAG: class I SAM-dependent methyltransferase [Candidatus Margulisbacteria bacterium]|jgi:tRNA (cmo5U34)-methyltransferase|nr:class I SAM-dependent methyltransferase [Candidatus Margulisiibacteriota bacterium]